MLRLYVNIVLTACKWHLSQAKAKHMLKNYHCGSLIWITFQSSCNLNTCENRVHSAAPEKGFNFYFVCLHKLSEDLRCAPHVTIFKSRLKTFLFSFAHSLAPKLVLNVIKPWSRPLVTPAGSDVSGLQLSSAGRFFSSTVLYSMFQKILIYTVKATFSMSLILLYVLLICSLILF